VVIFPSVTTDITLTLSRARDVHVRMCKSSCTKYVHCDTPGPGACDDDPTLQRRFFSIMDIHPCMERTADRIYTC
jgi:hypothetical protein